MFSWAVVSHQGTKRVSHELIEGPWWAKSRHSWTARNIHWFSALLQRTVSTREMLDVSPIRAQPEVVLGLNMGGQVWGVHVCLCVCVTVRSWLDYCSGLLTGLPTLTLPDLFQSILHIVGRVLFLEHTPPLHPNLSSHSEPKAKSLQ
jgi:hypothetical protein